MSIENNGPDAAYPGPDEKTPDTGEGHGSGLERAATEPKQGTEERPEDWNPPPGNPGSDQDAQTDRDNGSAGKDDGVDDELGFDPDSPDVSDPQVDPLHPARTSNDPVSRDSMPGQPVDKTS
ncbi:DUF6021 family protein [Pseudomonas sp. NPDC090202]|uniref:DUF6021 family protein n=1 Tax=Pseudomonas sp. NPDC090202 TaxID=3364476 RepID=UPI00380138AD